MCVMSRPEGGRAGAAQGGASRGQGPIADVIGQRRCKPRDHGWGACGRAACFGAGLPGPGAQRRAARPAAAWPGSSASRAGCGRAGDIRAGVRGRSIGLRAQDAEARRAGARARRPSAIRGPGSGFRGPGSGGGRWDDGGAGRVTSRLAGRWDGGPERRTRRTAQPAGARAPGRLEDDGPPARRLRVVGGGLQAP